MVSFTVAVNRKGGQGSEADFFRVSAWEKLGEVCKRYLAKGRKVCVIGPVSVSAYNAQDGKARANLEITAQDVEFLTPKGESEAPKAEAKAEAVREEDDLPF